MVRNYLFLSCIVFLSACAEMAPLTGGLEDDIAAVPVSQEPAQGALNVNVQELNVRFDEYFALNDPANTVVMNPNAGKVSVTNKRKDLKISWDGALQPNTTYIIQLNGTIRDLNEKNDTIHQFVFSTGNEIDSLTLKGRIADGFTNKIINGASVSLYASGADPFIHPPRYVSQSNAKGEFSFSYLKPGSYQLFAFQDVNKDRMIGKGERIAFSTQLVQAGDSVVQKINVFKPKDTIQKLQVKLIQPGLGVAYGRKIDIGQLLVNNESVSLVKQMEEDSVLFALPAPTNDFYSFIYESVDTVVKQFSTKERNQRFAITNLVYKNSWSFGDSLVFEVNEQINEIDTAFIRLVDRQKNNIAYQALLRENQVILVPQTNSLTDLQLSFRIGALKGLSNSNDSLTVELKTLRSADFSNLSLDVSEMNGKWVVQLMDGIKVVRSAYKSEADSLMHFKQLIPGVYQVLCIEDVNGNGKWDIGDWKNKTQPEQVVRFDLKSKLRPNWDIEEKLIVD